MAAWCICARASKRRSLAYLPSLGFEIGDNLGLKFCQFSWKMGSSVLLSFEGGDVVLHAQRTDNVEGIVKKFA